MKNNLKKIIIVNIIANIILNKETIEIQFLKKVLKMTKIDNIKKKMFKNKNKNRRNKLIINNLNINLKDHKL